jgi:hypothetical protein
MIQSEKDAANKELRELPGVENARQSLDVHTEFPKREQYSHETALTFWRTAVRNAQRVRG